MKFDNYLQEKLKNPKLKKHFEKYDLPVRLALEIVRAREAKGFTQSELGKLVGMDQSAIARLESGDDINPEFKTIAKIEAALRPHFVFVIGEPKKLAAA